MIFVNLEKAVNSHFDKSAEKFRADLEGLTCGAALQSWYYRDRMTAAAFSMVKDADPAALLPEAAKNKMLKRFSCENEKQRAKYLEKLKRAEAAPDTARFDICVNWTKNRTWGYNPTATINGDHGSTEGHASGCGYDKRSAAIASAANKNPEIMRILYKHAENGGAFPYSVNTFAGLPYFGGGCGVSCFAPVFDVCGYSWRFVAEGKTWDVYGLEARP